MALTSAKFDYYGTNLRGQGKDANNIFTPDSDSKSFGFGQNYITENDPTAVDFKLGDAITFTYSAALNRSEQGLYE